jgi:hypothetical protein
MTMTTKKEIFEEHKEEYWKASKARKGEIISHIVGVTRMHEKSVVRRFGVLQKKDSTSSERRGRSLYYDKGVDAALRDVWEAANYPCGELLHPMIAEYVGILERDRHWHHGDVATGKLLAMGEHTTRRRVTGFVHVRGKSKGLSATKPSQLKQIIPIFKGPWKDLPPGSGQLDTVAHCGTTLLGDFSYTVSYIDAATYWIISRAQWNKGAEATKANLMVIKEHLPVTLTFVHPDTGSEFINWILKAWCDEMGIEMTRSEPGKKNDNMYVEERNGHVVRKYLGYTRFDNPDVVPVMNELYEVLGLYLNHFQTVRRTLKKERVGAKIKRTYEKVPKTPYQRMLEHPEVDDEVKEKLRAEHEKLNPLILKRKIDRLTNKIMKLQKSAATKPNED